VASAGERGLILLSSKADELCESLIAIVGSQYDNCTFSRQDKAMKTPVDWHFRSRPKIVIFDISLMSVWPQVTMATLLLGVHCTIVRSTGVLVL
jgi:hypothetical protein